MHGPLRKLNEWDDFVTHRYDPHKKPNQFRNYTASAPSSVRELYRLNHMSQTRAFVLQKKKEYSVRQKMRMGIWEAMEYLNTLVDESDPDTDLSQIDHLLQTAEAIRKDGHPLWFILTGLIHDLGKVLWLYGEPQWAVVGDTFPVGCAYSNKIVFPEFLAFNPDSQIAAYQTRLGVYEEHGGLDNVDMSWGHDEYLYHVVKDYLPETARYIIRYHSFYAAHKKGAYSYLMNDHDKEMFRWVRTFSPYDLYSKTDSPPNAKQLQPYYQDLIVEFFPPSFEW